jgi:hypothetical protein
MDNPADFVTIQALNSCDVRPSRGPAHCCLKTRRRLGQTFVVMRICVCSRSPHLGRIARTEFLPVATHRSGLRHKPSARVPCPVPDVNYGKYVDGAYSAARERLFERLESTVDGDYAPARERTLFPWIRRAWSLPASQNALPVQISKGAPGAELCCRAARVAADHRRVVGTALAPARSDAPSRSG